MVDEWLTPKDAGRLLGKDPSSVAGWARSGRLMDSERRDGRWLVRRSEVERVLEEREATRERRAAKWRPMTERESTLRVDRPRCEAATAARTRCSWGSAGPVEVAGRPVELCPFHGERVRRWGDAAVPLHGRPAEAWDASPRGQRWSAEEDAYLRANPGAPPGVVAALLGRTASTVHKRRSVLNREEGRV